MGTHKQTRSLLLCLFMETVCSLSFGASASTWDAHFEALDQRSGKMTWDGHFDALDRAAKRRSITRALATPEPDAPLLDPDAVLVDIPYLYDPRDPSEQRLSKSAMAVSPGSSRAYGPALSPAPTPSIPQ